MTTAARRQRRHRWRRRTGRIHIRIDVSAVVIERLLDLGYLSEGDAETPPAIAAAILAAIEESVTA